MFQCYAFFRVYGAKTSVPQIALAALLDLSDFFNRHICRVTL